MLRLRARLISACIALMAFGLCLLPEALQAAAPEIISTQLLESSEGLGARVMPLLETQNGDYIYTYVAPPIINPPNPIVVNLSLVEKSKDLQEQWKTPVSYNIDTLAPALDGGYWVNIWESEDVGKPYRKITGTLIQKLSADGKLQEKIPLQVGEISDYLQAMPALQEVEDGFVVADWKKATPNYHVPWLAKFGKDGRLLWERSLQKYGDLTLSLRDNHDPVMFRRPQRLLVVSPKGEITFAVHAAIEKTEDSKIDYDKCPFLLRNTSNFVFKFDAQGKELARFKGPDSSSFPSIFENGSGYSLIETYQPASHLIKQRELCSRSMGQKDSKERREQLLFDVMNEGFAENSLPNGIRYTQLDSHLSVVQQKEYPSQLISGQTLAVEGPNGGYFVAGCNSSNIMSEDPIYHPGGVAYLNVNSGSLEITPLGGLNGHCEIIGLTANTTHDQATVFLNTTGVTSTINTFTAVKIKQPDR